LRSIVKRFGEWLILERHGVRLQAWCFGSILEEAARLEESIFFESFAEGSQLQWVDHAATHYAAVEYVKAPGEHSRRCRAMSIGPPSQLTIYPADRITCQLSRVTQPAEISWLVRAGNTCCSGAARIGCVTFEEHPKLEAIRTYFMHGHLWWEIAELEPVVLLSNYEPDHWHRITCHLDWATKTSKIHIEHLGPAAGLRSATTMCTVTRLGLHSAGCGGIGSIALGSVVWADIFPEGCMVHVSDVSLRVHGRIGFAHASC
jgi:hypothetical protein